jgi:tetratricopeptide (TPR) repeat protein
MDETRRGNRSFVTENRIDWSRGGRTFMASPQERSSGSPADGHAPEVSARRLREQSQREFELEFIGRILERDPFFVDAIRVHAENLAAVGQFTRSLQLDRRLVRLAPDDEVAWYNLACGYAVLGMVDPALVAIRRALELGYRCRERLRRDPDLKCLRRDPRFLLLLDRFEFIFS